jgi:aminomethyltransferase
MADAVSNAVIGPGYSALTSGAGLIDLSSRGRIRVTGEDRARLLHALSTNHIERLAPGQGCYAFFLNAQGKILADANILCFADYLLLDTEPEMREALRRHIEKYVIAEDVTLEDTELTVFGVEGPRAADAMAAAGAPVPGEDYAHAAWDDAVVARISHTGAPGFRIWVPRPQQDEAVARLGLPLATPEEARIVRLEHGKPRYGEDITDVTLPQESEQMHAVSFNKGCYLGQEIVERIRARGQVHRRLERLEYEPGHPPDAQITSEVYSPALGRMVGLGYVRSA